MTRPELITLLKTIIAEETGIAINEIADTDTFFNLGLDSVSCIFLMDKLEKKIKLELNPMFFWDYPSIDTYADFLLENVIPHGG
ncbi:MAG TPA: acyl carrier protein [Cyclobacteriaceae bacterium]|nr:acyl carrier protein [Cyclobacteriaceae bacterium]HMV10765.1 acyl carrier protein [Cyclobacteriaceae bacterium]HMV91273.1 acyl carrier protein [Cyclobacteriaceae bacterium]HMX01653.1 acyl carrier protein [Cyclobacteriaceae bacterium]HMX50653.1 acyl carrier protein [Cyclobacteriaceae bacterium]